MVKEAPTFHSLRHTHGSALIASGWDLSARLGHRDVTVTAKIYVHAYESARRSAARTNRLEAMYGANSVLTADGSDGQQVATLEGAEVLDLRAKRCAYKQAAAAGNNSTRERSAVRARPRPWAEKPASPRALSRATTRTRRAPAPESR